MKSIIFSSLVASLVPLVSGHARIAYPKPLGYGTAISADNTYNAPLKADGSDFPCKGLIGKPNVSMDPVTTWKAGQQAHFDITPNGVPPPGEGSLAAHSGGSCQASLSFDNGKTWKVVQSYIGGCPRGAALNSNLGSPNQTFNFEVPPETKAGNCLFSWSWIARTGNRDEFYQNCASVKIDGYGASTLSDYPDMYLGEMVTGPIKQGMCASTAGFNLLYPNPGKNVVYAHEDDSKPVGPHNQDGSTDFSMCKAPQSQDSSAPAPSNPAQQPSQTSAAAQPPAISSPPSQPYQTSSAVQPPAASSPPSQTSAALQPPAQTPAGQPSQAAPCQASSPAQFQEITLGSVTYECRPKVHSNSAPYY